MNESVLVKNIPIEGSTVAATRTRKKEFCINIVNKVMQKTWMIAFQTLPEQHEWREVITTAQEFLQRGGDFPLDSDLVKGTNETTMLDTIEDSLEDTPRGTKKKQTEKNEEVDGSEQNIDEKIDAVEGSDKE